MSDLFKPVAGDIDIELDDREENADAIVACLGDDAAHLRLNNPECEMATNLDAAAVLIEELRAEVLQLKTAKALMHQACDQMEAAGWLAGTMHFARIDEAQLARDAGLEVTPVFKLKGST